LPFGPGQQPPFVEETPMAGGRAFLIRYAGYVDVFLINDEAGRVIDNGIFGSDFRLVWARLREGEPLPDEIVLLQGSLLEVNGRRLIDNAASQFASVRRFGNEFYVKTDLGRSARSLKA